MFAEEASAPILYIYIYIYSFSDLDMQLRNGFNFTRF